MENPRTNRGTSVALVIEVHCVAFVSLPRTPRQRRTRGLSTRFWFGDVTTRSLHADDLAICVPAPEYELIFLLYQSRLKPKERYRRRCLRLLEQAEVRTWVSSEVGSSGLLEIEQWIGHGDAVDAVEDVLAVLVLSILPRRRPIEMARVIRNHVTSLFRDRGLIVFFLGPDGAGKTTTSGALAEFLVTSGLTVRQTDNLYYLQSHSI